MFSIIATLLSNPTVQAVLVGGVMYVGGKVAKVFGDNKAGKLAALIATCEALMVQYVLTEPNKTPEQVIVALKGIVAVQFAKAGYTEAQRAPFQGVIDKAISAQMAQWVRLHPSPSSLTMPITKLVEAKAA